jgi:hypothetical protein
VIRIEAIAHALGGTIEHRNGYTWLTTTIDDLRAIVMPAATGSSRFDIGVLTTDAPPFLPIFASWAHGTWRVDETIPRLDHGFVYLGFQNGALFARSLNSPTLNELVSALSQLAVWARERWTPASNQASRLAQERERYERRRNRVMRAAIVVAVVLIAMWRRR